jgi:predicted permease
MSNLFGRRAFEHQITDEVRFHIESRAADLVRSGIRPADAARRARLEFGAPERWKEEMREARGLGWIDAARVDLRYALRTLRKNPAFAFVAILSLALGIGANTAIFHVLNVVRLRALPIPDPGRVASVRAKDSHGGMGVNSFPADMTYPLFEQLRDRQQALDGLFAWGHGGAAIGDGANLRPVRLLWVSGEAFRTLGIAAERGRLLTPDDDRRGCAAPASAVLSHSLWQSQFGGRDDIIGKRVTIFMLQAVVVGVAPASFFGLEVGRAFDIAVPLCARGPSLDARNVWWLSVVGRLKPGWTVDRASAHLDTLSPGIFEATVPMGYAAASVEKYRTLRLEALPGANGLSALRQQYDASLWLLLAMTGSVLLVACANLANLTLARANVRAREFAVRLALGASRGRLARQLLCESLLLSSIGALGGLGLARTLARVIVDFLRTSNDPIPLDLTMDWRVFVFAAALGVVTCALFGLAAARRSAYTNPGAALKTDARAGAGRERFSFQRVLVTLQIAASLVLVVGAMQLVQTFRNLVTLDPGFRTEEVLTAFVNVARLGLPRERRERFKQELLDRLDALSEVEAAATTTNIPLFGSSWTMGVRLVGAPDERRSSKITFISPGYFRTMRIPLLRGREFTVKDDKASAGVAIVNQTFIQQFLNGVNPIGQAFQTGQEPGYPAATYEIVGIVADTKYSRLREEIRPIAFIPAAQHPSPQDGVAIIIRASGPASAVPPAVRRLLANLDSRIALAGISDYETQIRETLVQERLMAALSGFFGQLAMIIAAIGLYGLVSYIVSTRQHELGLRVALGATRANVLGLVLRQSLMLVACGLVIGVPAALLLTRWMTSLVFGLSPRDVPTIAMAVTMLAVVALGAALIPARRAASVDPMVALRVE